MKIKINVHRPRVINWDGKLPRPRHGHRACTANDRKDVLILVGGNDGMIDAINIFDTASKLLESTK